MSQKKAKKIKAGVVVHIMHEGVRHTFTGGDTVPDWANITNPDVLADGDTAPETPPAPPAGNDADKKVDTAPVSTAPTLQELKDEAKSLGLAVRGSKDDLIARIAAKKAETAPADETDVPAGEEDSTRAALEERATERGIEFDENTTDDELEALLDE